MTKFFIHRKDAKIAKKIFNGIIVFLASVASFFTRLWISNIKTLLL